MWTAMSVRANTTLTVYSLLWWKGESERFSELECTCVLCARVCLSMCMRVCSGLWANDKLQIAIKFQCITSSMFVRVAFVLVCSVCVCVWALGVVYCTTITESIYGLHSSIIECLPPKWSWVEMLYGKKVTLAVYVRDGRVQMSVCVHYVRSHTVMMTMAVVMVVVAYDSVWCW